MDPMAAAAALGVSVLTLTRYENGSLRIDAQTLFVICQLFDVKAGVFFADFPDALFPRGISNRAASILPPLPLDD